DRAAPASEPVSAAPNSQNPTFEASISGPVASSAASRPGRQQRPSPRTRRRRKQMILPISSAASAIPPPGRIPSPPSDRGNPHADGAVLLPVRRVDTY